MHNTIFVSIAAYRDKLCSDTVSEIFTKAKNPQSIYIGIVQQNDEDTDVDCIRDNSKLSNYLQNIRIIRIKNSESKGATFARYLATTLYNNEDYFLQVDSHLKFIPNWDELCINMMEQ